MNRREVITGALASVAALALPAAGAAVSVFEASDITFTASGSEGLGDWSWYLYYDPDTGDCWETSKRDGWEWHRSKYKGVLTDWHKIRPC